MQNCAKLTQAETETMQLLADGLTDEQISKLRVVSVHTTRMHTASIYRKFNVCGRTQAVIKWLMQKKDHEIS